MLKQILPHLMSVTDQIGVVDDAILLANQEQHIQWVENISSQGVHHLNTYSLTRLWDLSAPSDYVLSTKGIMLAVAEQLDIDALEIDPYVDLRNYGLDSVAVVSLVGVFVMKMYDSMHLCMNWQASFYNPQVDTLRLSIFMT